MKPDSRSTAILGFGRFGRALGDLLLDSGRPVRAFDPEAAVPPALRADSLAELVRDADEVVLAIPVEAIAAAAQALRPHLGPAHLVLDVSSVKHAAVRDLAEAFGREVPWIATHPLFGPTSISRGERPLVAVVCPNSLHPEAAGRARTFFSSLGCEVVEQDAVGHDRAMAATHALAFFVAKGLIDIHAGEQAPFVPPSFRAMAGMIDAVRSDASHLFATIQNGNPFSAESRASLLAALVAIDADLRSAPEAPGPEAPSLTIPPLPAPAGEAGDPPDPVDALDQELLRLLSRRLQLIRRADRARASPAAREGSAEGAWLAERRNWAKEAGLDPEGVADIFRRMASLGSRAPQEVE